MKWVTLHIPEIYLSFDECMVKYFDTHGCKQQINGKPNRFGHKVWCLNTVDRYLEDFEIHPGKSISLNKRYEISLEKAGTPLITMLDTLSNDKKLLLYHLYFDNLFTCLNLLRCLKEPGYHALGTIREISRQFAKKMQQLLRSGQIIQSSHLLRIAMALSHFPPSKDTLDYIKKTIQMLRPYVLEEYNKYMGGTDRMDENVVKYRINIRNKKWYWSLFSQLIDICIHNAWMLKQKFGSSTTSISTRNCTNLSWPMEKQQKVQEDLPPRISPSQKGYPKK